MEAMLNSLVNAIGWSIIHSLWQGAVIFAFLLIAFAVNKKWSAKTKYNLSLGALLLMALSFFITFGGLFTLPTATNVAVINKAPFQFNSLSIAGNTEKYFPIIGMLYFVGLVFQMVVIGTSYFKLKELKKTGSQLFPEEWQNIANDTLSKLRLKKKVKFYVSDRVNVPLVIGFLKPVVLFPITFVSNLDSKQVEAILIHELSHIRRNDYLMNILKTAIETVLFFNPFVWLTSRFIQIERENACDDIVVEHTNSPVAYAHVLLKLELIKDKSKPVLSLAATGKNQYLYERIKRITHMKTTYMNTRQKLTAFVLTLVTIVFIAWINPKKAKAKEVNTVKSEQIRIDKVSKRVTLRSDTDSVKKKKRYSEIIIINKDGKTTTYKNGKKLIDSPHLELPSISFKFDKMDSGIRMMDMKALDFSNVFDNEKLKELLGKVALDSKRIQEMFNAKEWKDRIVKIELDGKKIAEQFDSKEWKDRVKKIELDGKKIEELFNSKEWKEKIDKIEFKSKEIEKKYNSPEWKQRMKEYEELHNSKEYKELREKYEKDLERLKKKNGFSHIGMTLHVESATPLEILPTSSPNSDIKIKNLKSKTIVVQQL
jgi:bla regulator protein BlaR1